ncbi:MAG TPA: 2-oxo acid dehydrogenase subunit E2 [Steroidobacteraceae bacterium]|nr:2-oxo acid dehydrogenase subunit E2 [Steroidobacteraceae bacterium]
MRESLPLVVPRMNVNDDQAIISAWLVPVGEHVAEGQAIATLETTKATFDVNADREGYVGYELKAKSIVAVGEVFAWISDEREARPPVANEAPSRSPASAVDATGDGRITRKALRRMRELGVSLDELAGIEHVTVADVERIAAAREQSQTQLRSAEPDDGSVPLEQTAAKVAEAARLAESYRSIVPSLVTLPVSCERVQAKLRALGAELGPVSLLELVIREVAAVLPEFPELNGYFKNGRAATYREVAVGFAVNAGRSLRVPVLHATNELTQLEVCRMVRELMLRYMRNELSMADVSGGTFTVTDLSAQGVTHFVPVLNDRQSAILGICAPEPQQHHQNLVLAFDHRMADGMGAGNFLGHLRERLEG